MELNLQTIMMLVFIVALVVSLWKIAPFFSAKQLSDDDTTKESQEELLKLVEKHLAKQSKPIDTKKLLKDIKNDEGFNKEHFWRFNENKLINLLRRLDQ
jgi:hypothetical protein